MSDKKNAGHPQQEHQYRNSSVFSKQSGPEKSSKPEENSAPPMPDELWTREEAEELRQKKAGNDQSQQEKIDEAIRDQYDSEGTGSVYTEKNRVEDK